MGHISAASRPVPNDFAFPGKTTSGGATFFAASWLSAGKMDDPWLLRVRGAPTCQIQVKRP
jgi:hypothetical protein